MGDKRRQDLRKADAPSNTGTHVEKKRDKVRQDLGKAVTQHRHTCGAHMREDNMGNKGGQGRTRPREGRRTIQQRKIRRETRLQKRGHTIQDREIRRDTKGGKPGGTRRQHPTQGDKAGQDLGRRAHHPPQAHMWGDMGEKLGDQARQELGNVDAPSNTGSPQKGEHHPTQAHICGRRWATSGGKGRQDLGKARAAHIRGNNG